MKRPRTRVCPCEAHLARIPSPGYGSTLNIFPDRGVERREDESPDAIFAVSRNLVPLPCFLLVRPGNFVVLLDDTLKDSVGNSQL